jgi:hypothetical protein
MTGEERREAWEDAFRKTLVALCEARKIRV